MSRVCSSICSSTKTVVFITAFTNQSTGIKLVIFETHGTKCTDKILENLPYSVSVSLLWNSFSNSKV